MRKAHTISYELLLQVLNRTSTISPSLLRQTHALILTRGLWRKSVLICKLTSLYGNLLDFHHARKLFDTMPLKNTRALNCLLKGYIQGSDFISAFKLYFLSLSVVEAVPDAMTFSLLLKGCGDVGFSKAGLFLHAHVILIGCEPDLHLYTDLVHFYLSFGFDDHARKLFDGISQRDLILYTTMVDGLMRNGNHTEALEFFSMMRSSGIRPNSASWNAVISGFSRDGLESEALLHLRQMQTDDIFPDQATLCIILPLLAKSAMALRYGAAVHGYAVRKNFFQDLFVTSALLDMYAKNGHLPLAARLFENSAEKDTGLWNSMILALALHGYGDRALLLLDQLLTSGAKPNQITFTAALSACNHSGLVDEGFRIFRSMILDHRISPSCEHLSCLVDLLGRSGRLEEAILLVSSLPKPPSEDISGALLAACRTHTGMAKFSTFFSGVSHQSSGDLVALSNIYADAGKWEDVSRVRILMRDAGLRKQTAHSWIELGGKIHAFKMFDELHPQKNHIYDALGYLEANVSEPKVNDWGFLGCGDEEM